ncbi:MAG: aminomethyl-transferring glycine dehydrogenase [Bdellovibrionales bacterium]|nr:aminomethyl-transferring glycine dehydrogenase [Bdellovibrionales bacterium]
MRENSEFTFASRHIGPREKDIAAMLQFLGYSSLTELIEATVPGDIRFRSELDLPPPESELAALEHLRGMMSRNRVLRSLIGMGYAEGITPGVIQRNILENPGGYTQYTPYQAEISQGRLEALLNFQTMVSDLTGLEVANASLLDEATAAAEAMVMVHTPETPADAVFFVDASCHPQTIGVVKTRAEAIGISVKVGAMAELSKEGGRVFGVLYQYPDTLGALRDPDAVSASAHALGAKLIVATDLLALCLLREPGAFGADVAIGNSQRLGVPLGYGGPHAAFISCREELKRKLPGRIVGVSKDAQGRPGLRLALQTREQHIRRDKATSNICTAQVLLAVMAGMYAVYHGPRGMRAIAARVHRMTRLLAAGLSEMGFRLESEHYFDTIAVKLPGGRRDAIAQAAVSRGFNLRAFGSEGLSISLDERTDEREVESVLGIFSEGKSAPRIQELRTRVDGAASTAWERKSAFLQHAVFNSHHSETEMLRYIRRLESRDLSLTTSMIPLGSCTMKLNASAEMFPVSWPETARMHPFVPLDQAQGYQELFRDLEGMLARITGFSAVSLQPNAGSQGEYAGLLVIRKYLQEKGQGARNVCLIPQSAHGTNPASAALAGMEVVVVRCDDQGNIDVSDLQAKIDANSGRIAAMMVTYPSTHGVFEKPIREICKKVHDAGGQVYMDGANMNAQVGLCRPGDFGPDVIHLNLHKTFCVPHGGGGPGVGPICVREHLAPFLPGHPVVKSGGSKAIGPVSAAPWGSPSILPISWMYIRMMGPEGLKKATEVAILSANYIAKRLEPSFPVLYKGSQGRVAHECIIDLRSLKASSGIEVEDVAKRLIDYGFHAPTMSFPVAGTLMIEPTESEPKAELDRLCDALIAIRGEMDRVASGKWDRKDNPLKNAPHTSAAVTASEWVHPYSREVGAFPAPWTREQKFWPSVARIDNAYGDRNLVCTCPPLEAYRPT